MRFLFIFIVILNIFGCTSVTVKPVSPKEKITSICIENNDTVIVDGFIMVLRDAISRHNISSKVVEKNTSKDCEYVLTYDANQGWDFVLYLRQADVHLEKNGMIVGSAEYHHYGGFDFSKYASTKSKMDPVMDQLLANIK